MSDPRLHPQVAALLAAGGALADEGPDAPPPPAGPDLEALRAGYAPAAEELGGMPEAVAEARDIDVPGDAGSPIPVRRYRPLVPAPGEPGLVVWCHGGGWVVGDLDGIDRVCRAICARSGHQVLSVDYRLAPEHPFPAALDDCAAVVRYAAGREGAAALGVAPGRVVVGGDSAGGNLAAACARRARDEGVGVLGQLLAYPALDPAGATASYAEFGEGPLLSAVDMAQMWSAYAAVPAGDLAVRAGADPALAPGRAEDLAGLPPAHVAVAEIDPLRDEGLAYAARLAASGVPVTTVTHVGMAHGFVRWGGVCDATHVLLDALAGSARRFLA